VGSSLLRLVPAVPDAGTSRVVTAPVRRVVRRLVGSDSPPGPVGHRVVASRRLLGRVVSAGRPEAGEVRRLVGSHQRLGRAASMGPVVLAGRRAVASRLRLDRVAVAVLLGLVGRVVLVRQLVLAVLGRRVVVSHLRVALVGRLVPVVGQLGRVVSVGLLGPEDLVGRRVATAGRVSSVGLGLVRPGVRMMGSGGPAGSGGRVVPLLLDPGDSVARRPRAAGRRSTGSGDRRRVRPVVSRPACQVVSLRRCTLVSRR
jgi:hypothetical protein